MFYNVVLVSAIQQSESAICIHIVAAAAIESVVSDSVRPHRQQPNRLLCPWDSPGKQYQAFNSLTTLRTNRAKMDLLTSYFALSSEFYCADF